MRYRFVFWQNINSMHQSAFLKALAQRHEVVLVTTEPDSGRAHMGWEEPELPNVRVLPFDGIDWRGLLQSRRGSGDWHVFSGLQAFRKIHSAFVYASTLGCRTGLYAEPLRMGGVAGFLKRIRGTLDGRRFGPGIGFVLCMGEAARLQFIDWGFPPRKLHKWAYVTEPPLRNQADAERTGGVRGVFPASLIYRKGADILVEAVERLGNAEVVRIDAYSIDPADLSAWQRRLIERAHAGGILRIHPFIGNRSLVGQLSMSDFTILPSRFDGWGAVVNESLSVGTPVVVSRYCGASELLRGRASLGRVLERLDPVSLAEAIEEAALKGCTGADQRQRIAEWARTVISGESLCRYFLEILERADSGADSVLAAPWESLDPISEHQRPMA